MTYTLPVCTEVEDNSEDTLPVCTEVEDNNDIHNMWISDNLHSVLCGHKNV